MPKQLRYLIGGGAHGVALLDAILSSNQKVTGIIDPNLELGTEIFGVPVVGNDSFLIDSIDASTDVLINGLGSTGNLELHRNMFEDLSKRGFTFNGATHPSANLGRNCDIDKTSQIMAGVIVQNNVKIGKNVILNTRSSVDHDVTIGDHSIISPGAIICGNVKIGSGVFVGAGAVIIQGIQIGNDCIVGAGTVVRHNIKSAMTSLGKTQRQTVDHTALLEYDTLIKDHYDNVGKIATSTGSSSMADLIIRDQETQFILNQVKKFIGETATPKTSTASVLDVGCGSGHTLMTILKNFSNCEIVGIEQNETMRASADNFIKSTDVNILPGDIRDSSTLPNRKFDIVICQRVIINILKKADQILALENLVKLIDPSGLLVLIESFNSGLINLNDAREEFGLDRILPAHHNLYLDDDFLNHPKLIKLKNSDENALSSHYFISRVLHPAILKSLGVEESRNSHFTSFLSSTITNSAGDFSPLKFFAFQKL